VVNLGFSVFLVV